MTLLILSCDKFSDLWDGHIKLLEQNWPDRDIETYIVTDVPTMKNYQNVKVIAAGKNMEWSERLAFALEKIETEYVFISLDDYYLIKKVSDSGIQELLYLLATDGYDYIRLYDKPDRATKKELTNHKKIYNVDTSVTYSVNLYPAIWKKEFLQFTTNTPLNPWRFEVKLSQKAREYGAKCIVSKRKDFQILDVVRKGKILHKANKYFKRHPYIYEGNRALQSKRYEIKLYIQTFVSEILPLWSHKYLKAFMRGFGMHFFSDEIE